MCQPDQDRMQVQHSLTSLSLEMTPPGTSIPGCIHIASTPSQGDATPSGATVATASSGATVATASYANVSSLAVATASYANVSSLEFHSKPRLWPDAGVSVS